MNEFDEQKFNINPEREITRKTKHKKTLIILIVIIILGLGGYLVYDKVSREKPKEESKQEIKKNNKKEETEDLDATANELIEIIDTYSLDQLDVYERNATFTAILSKQQILTMFTHFGYLGAGNSITKESVSKYIKNVYGIELKEYPDIKCEVDDIPFYKYDVSKGEYVQILDHPGHGGMYIARSSSRQIYSITKEEDSYVLVLGKLYISNNEYEGDARVSFGVGQSSVRDFDGFINEGIVDEEGAIDYYNSNYAKFKELKPRYKYTFKKDNDNYYLIKYEVIK